MKLNHNLIVTSDLEAMSCFWTDAIGLTIGDRPPFPYKGLSFHSEGKALIHVTEHNNINPDTGVIAHIAIEGDDYDILISNLKQQTYYYNEMDLPLSGERRVYVAGPDGLIVEILFAPKATDGVFHPF